MAAIVIPVTDNSFDPEVLKCDIPVLAHFWAEWSAQSRKVNPLLSAIAADYRRRLRWLAWKLRPIRSPPPTIRC